MAAWLAVNAKLSCKLNFKMVLYTVVSAMVGSLRILLSTSTSLKEARSFNPPPNNTMSSNFMPAAKAKVPGLFNSPVMVTVAGSFNSTLLYTCKESSLRKAMAKSELDVKFTEVTVVSLVALVLNNKARPTKAFSFN